jgi:hypothetical protein
MSVPVLIGLVVAVLAVVFVVAPLIWPTTFGVRDEARPASAAPVAAGDALARLRDDLFTRIVELDFEQATGKLDEEEYHQERVALKRRALAVLRTLDEQTAPLAEADHTIERAVDAARARRVPPAAQPASTKDDTWFGDEVEREVLALRRARQAPAARVGHDSA